MRYTLTAWIDFAETASLETTYDELTPLRAAITRAVAQVISDAKVEFELAPTNADTFASGGSGLASA